MIPLTEIFCLTDNFYKLFDQENHKYMIPAPKKNR